MICQIFLILVVCVDLGWSVGSSDTVCTATGNCDERAGPGPTWSYTGAQGPAFWGDLYPNFCDASTNKLQSPINIITADTKEAKPGPIFYSRYNTEATTWTIINNQHSIEITITSDEPEPTISGNSLNGDRYQLLQAHFHYAKTGHGSEHMLDGVGYAGELHLVHWNTKYRDVAAALKKRDGLAVLGFFLEKSTADNPALSPILDQLTNLVPDPSSDNEIVTSVQGINLEDIIPSPLNEYYYYEGSLTNPTCNEIVQWTVYPTTIPISSTQLDLLNNNCFKGWTQFENSCYKQQPAMMTWDEAQDACLAAHAGSNLVSLQSDAEVDFVKQITTSEYWTGGYRKPGGTWPYNWIWVDGSTFSYYNWLDPNQDGGEPGISLLRRFILADDTASADWITEAPSEMKTSVCKYNLSPNNRPVQPLNCRKVYQRVENAITDPVHELVYFLKNLLMEFINLILPRFPKNRY